MMGSTMNRHGPIPRRFIGSFVAVLAWALPASFSVAADFWSDHVEPVLREHCVECHSQTKSKGGLDLSTCGVQAQMTSRKTSLYLFSAGVDASRDVTGGSNSDLQKLFMTLAARPGAWGRLRVDWFVLIAAIRDWTVEDSDQGRNRT